MGISKALVDEVVAVYGSKMDEKFDHVHKNIIAILNQYIPSDGGLIAQISGQQIFDVVQNYFVDIHRFKQRRDMVAPNDYISAGKIAAFTAKWLVRLKPVLITWDSKYEPANDVRFFSRYINEVIAVAHAEDILGIDIPGKLVKELIVDFRQKKLGETQLYMLFEQCSGYYDNRSYC